MDNNPIIAVAFLVYSLIILSVGIFSTRFRKKGDHDFLLASRSLGPWVAAFSASASSESAWLVMGLVKEGFDEGVAALWVTPGCLLGYLINWFIIAEPLRKRSAEQGSLTVPGYIADRFNEKKPLLRLIAAIIILASMTCYVCAQFDASGKIFMSIFGTSFRWGVIIGATYVLIYTIMGGFRAACWTDFVQALLMLVSLIIIPVLALTKIGGPGNLITGLKSVDPNLTSFLGGKSGIFFIIGLLLGKFGIGLGYPGQPHVLVRLMALKDKKTTSQARMIAPIWMILVFAGSTTAGMCGRLLFPPEQYGNNPEMILPVAAGTMLPGFLAGIIIAGMFAAFCSTADSQLLVASSAISRDIFHKKYKEISSTFSRICVLVLGIIAALMALPEEKNIYRFVLDYGWAFLGASFGPVIILSLLWKSITRWGAFAGMITGFTVTFIWKNIEILNNALYNLVAAFVCAFIAIIIVSFLTGDSKDALNNE